MSAAARAAVIQEYLQTLKLPAFRRSYEALARQAGADGWTYEDYLRELLEAEVQSRQERAAACGPTGDDLALPMPAARLYG
jgi:hypothetical protein